jgi:DNA ligase-1
MTSCQVFKAIEKIAATSSKNDKQALVKQFLAFETFRRVCVAALDPTTRYYMRQVPDRIENAAPGANTFENAPVWETLEKLKKRELSGNAARDEVQRLMTFLTPESAELFKRIIRMDLRAGFSASSVNKGMPGLIAEFPYMRCVLPKKAKFDQWEWEEGVISQEKADGLYCNLDHDEDGNVELRTRQGNPLPLEQFGDVVREAQARFDRGTETHGEIVVLIDGVIADREIGNGIVNSVVAGGAFEANQKPLYLAWDQIPLSAVKPKGEHRVGYKQRFKALLQQLARTPGESIRVIPTRVVYSLRAAYEHCRELQLKKKEGIVIKRTTGIWKDTDSGNPDVVKLKVEAEADLVLRKIVPGRVGTKNEGRPGSITCETSCGQLVVDVTVKNEKMRNAIEADWSAWEGRVMKVLFNDINEPSPSNDRHSFFLPRFAEDTVRVDKDVADDLPRCRQLFEAAINGGAALEVA